MAFCCLSELDGSDPTYFDIDPETYADGPAERRVSSHAVGDGRVWQDFGVKVCDRVIQLRTGWMEAATVDAFLDKFAQTGKSWKWTDYKNHSYQVLFRSLGAEQIRGHDAYEVDMRLEVIEVL